MTVWLRRDSAYTAQEAGCNLKVRLKDAVAAALAEGRDNGDTWPWYFEVTLPDGLDVLRGVRETLAEAQQAAVAKAREWGEVAVPVLNAG